jgi:excisionase family DNA binding protein
MKYLTIKESAEITEKSFQAVFQAMKRGTLQSTYIDGVRYTTHAWLKEYEERKYCTDGIVKGGKRIFDPQKGTYSVKQAAELLGVAVTTVYQYIYMGVIKTSRVGDYHIVSSQEICKHQQRRARKDRKSA